MQREAMNFLRNSLGSGLSNVSAIEVLVAYIPISSSLPSCKRTVGCFGLLWQAPESLPVSIFIPGVCTGKKRPMSGNMSIKAFPFIVLILTGIHLCGRTSAHYDNNNNSHGIVAEAQKY